MMTSILVLFSNQVCHFWTISPHWWASIAVRTTRPESIGWASGSMTAVPGGVGRLNIIPKPSMAIAGLPACADRVRAA